MSSISSDSQPRGVKRTRVRSGCLNCRARRKKCDESKPVCSRCQALHDSCHYDEAFPFRSIGISAQHPSMLQSPKSNSNSAIQIVDVDFSRHVKRRKTRSIQVQENQQVAEDAASPPARESGEANFNQTQKPNDRPLRSSINSHGRSTASTSAPPPPPVPKQTILASKAPNASDQGNFTDLPLPSSVTDSLQFDSIDLGTLDYLTSHVSNIDMLASGIQLGDVANWSPEAEFPMLNAGDSLSASSPDMYSMYYPNAQYRELHSTLHHHMVQTARNTALNKQNSPEPVARNSNLDKPTYTSFSRSNSQEKPPASSYLKCDLVTPRRQLELWRNYLDEIAPWLDMLDYDRHFQTTIPLMAKTAPVLHYSILSLSARQIERRSSERSYTESLALYQQAIQMIANRLQALETEVIASCVLLCVLEMMSSSPRAWARHLDGCAMLLEAAGINGAVGGVRQAVFWCFARMDLWGGYLGDTITKIPINRWFIPSGSMAEAVSQFKAGTHADTYANYAVFLCASVVNVISTQEVNHPNRRSRPFTSSELYSTRWKALYDLLEDWYNDRPEELLPLMNEQPTLSDYSNPFPIVLYGTSFGVSGNQMYHTAALLMLQHKPKDVRLPKSRKSIIWHARQICGTAASNTDHSAWTNALQPLWMAGKVMSHPSEHQAILHVLHRIEKETGFATEWRAYDLKEFWGETSE